MQYPITPEEIRKNLQTRIDENTAELLALDAVVINTKHATLTNRSVNGFGARIGDYIGIGKALYVSYSIKYKDGHTRYASRDITAYTYNNPDGSEIGNHGIMRISRTMTPNELNAVLQEVMAALSQSIKELRSEYRRADSIARKHNELIDKINEYNKDLSYASKAQI